MSPPGTTAACVAHPAGWSTNRVAPPHYVRDRERGAVRLRRQAPPAGRRGAAVGRHGGTRRVPWRRRRRGWRDPPLRGGGHLGLRAGRHRPGADTGADRRAGTAVRGSRPRGARAAHRHLRRAGDAPSVSRQGPSAAVRGEHRRGGGQPLLPQGARRRRHRGAPPAPRARPPTPSRTAVTTPPGSPRRSSSSVATSRCGRRRSIGSPTPPPSPSSWPSGLDTMETACSARSSGSSTSSPGTTRRCGSPPPPCSQRRSRTSSPPSGCSSASSTRGRPPGTSPCSTRPSTAGWPRPARSSRSPPCSRASCGTRLVRTSRPPTSWRRCGATAPAAASPVARRSTPTAATWARTRSRDSTSGSTWSAGTVSTPLSCSCRAETRWSCRRTCGPRRGPPPFARWSSSPASTPTPAPRTGCSCTTAWSSIPTPTRRGRRTPCSRWRGPASWEPRARRGGGDVEMSALDLARLRASGACTVSADETVRAGCRRHRTLVAGAPGPRPCSPATPRRRHRPTSRSCRRRSPIRRSSRWVCASASRGSTGTTIPIPVAPSRWTTSPQRRAASASRWPPAGTSSAPVRNVLVQARLLVHR